MNRHALRIGLRAAVGLAMVVLAACATRPVEPQPEAIASTAPPVREFSEAVTPVRDYPTEPSRGECAPKYKNGKLGSCVADKPCRGYGIRTDAGELMCMCYLSKGGCDAKSRCDGRAHACVPDEKAEDGFD